MKAAVCHYSFHRTWQEKGWDCSTLVAAVKELGVQGIDFHAGLLGSPEGAVQRIRTALAGSDLELSSLSLSTNFYLPDAAARRTMIAQTGEWIRVAAELQAPVCRVFGGSLPAEEAARPESKKAALEVIIDALGEVAREAERAGVVLALENHGGLPCSGEEQVSVIEAVDSTALRATVDVGNYLACGQEGHVGTRVAASYAAYVHFKDMRKVPTESTPWGWEIQPCVLGRGDVDLRRCLQELSAAGYTEYVALEYEAQEAEQTGVPASVEHMKSLLEEQE